MTGGPFAELLSPPDWLLEVTLTDPAERAFGDALLHLSNGRQGIRALADPGDPHAEPGFYLADCYDTGIDVRRELVNLPHPLGLAVRRENQLLHRDTSGTQLLDLGQGLVYAEHGFRSANGDRWALHTLTAVHAVDTATGILLGELVSPPDSGLVAVECCWDYTAGNPYLGGRLPNLRHFPVHVRSASFDAGATTLDCVLGGTGKAIRLHSDVRCARETGLFPVRERSRWGHAVVADTETSAPFSLQWTVEGPPNPASLEDLLDAHRARWRERWARYDIVLDGDPSAQKALRFGLFQLLQHELPERDAVLSPARGLSGSYHAGATFFDTELHKDAFWAWTEPAVARSHLCYRYRCLPEARRFAKTTGFAGARFPVAADDLGGDTGPHEVFGAPGTGRYPERNSREVVHISADVAYATDRYLRLTGDEDFLLRYGLELLVETARFAASVFRWSAGRGRFVATSVMGPDEYHPGVDHNLYTSVLLRWNLRTAVGAIRKAAAANRVAVAGLLGRLAVTDAELDTWSTIADHVYLPPPLVGGAPAQHEGYGELPDCAPRTDPGTPEPRLTAGELRAGLHDVPSKLVKQADVILLARLLPGELGESSVRAALDFYEPRTAHASSLSFAPHGVVAARLGRAADARRFFLRAARYNLDYRPRTGYQNGLHLSAYAGAWQVLAEGMLGLELDGDDLVLDPVLPEQWRRVEVPVRVLGRSIRLCVQPGEVSITVHSGQEMSVRVHAQRVLAPANKEITVTGGAQ